MRKLKRIISFCTAAALTATLMLGGTSTNAAADPSTEQNVTTATATLGKSLVSTGFESVEVGNVSGAVLTSKDGREAWLLDKSQGTNKASINAVLSEQFKHTKKDGSVYEIEVDYYDSGNGLLRLYYDSYTNTKKTAETVYTNKENKWKTLKVTLDDAEFAKKCDNKCDISVSIAIQSVSSTVGTESIAVSEIRVKRYAAKNPIYVTSSNDEVGNAYKWFSDSKVMHNVFENTTAEKQNVTVTYKLLSKEYLKVFEKSEKLSFEPKETKNIDVDMGEVKRCDMYSYYVDIKSDDGKINSTFKAMEFSIIKTDPNGIKNDTYFAAHLSRYPEEQREMGVEMVKNANAAGIRGGWDWEYFEYQVGTFSPDRLGDSKVLALLLERDMHFLCQFTATNTKHGMKDWKDYPDTPEELELFRTYVHNAAKAVDGKVDGIEIFNEPNIDSFNRHVADGPDRAAQVYVDCLKVAYEEIKKVNPNLKVGGPVLCFINNEKGKDFFNAAMKYGMWKYLDALDLHQYANNFVEKTGLQPHIEWYKEEFEKVGKGDIEFWYSEMGYTTADNPIKTEYNQGAYNAASVMFYKSKNFGDKFVFYNLEQKGTNKADREDMFGHTSPGYVASSVNGKWFVPRESYLIVTAMNYYMARTTTKDSYYSEDGNVSVNRFKSDKFNSDMIGIYSMDGRRNITLDLGTDKITYADMYGNETEMSSDSGIYTITVDKAPIYLIGNTTKDELVESESAAKVNASNADVAHNDQYTIELEGDSEFEIETVTPECIGNVKINGYKDGKASVVFENNADPGEVYEVVLKLKRNGKTFQICEIMATSVETASFTTDVSLINDNNLNRWSAEFKITNYSETKPLKGKIRITAPEEFKTDYTDIGLVPCGTTGRVSLNLPEIRKKGEYNVEYELVLDSGAVINSANKIDFTLAKYADKKPTIDGVAEKGEWNNDTLMYAEKDYQIKQITDWKGKNDLSAKSCIEWDEENMYLFCEVTDDIFNQPDPAATSWRGDSVQVGIFYGDEVQVAIGQKNISFHELCMSKTPDGDRVYRFLAQDDSHPKGDITDKCNIAIMREGNKTVYEFKIPWKNLLMDGQQPKLGDKLGFSFLVNDNDGNGRRGWIEYASGVGESKNSALFTYLKLIK